MPRNPRTYIPPGVGKRVTRAEAAAEAAKAKGEPVTTPQARALPSTSKGKVAKTQASKKLPAQNFQATSIQRKRREGTSDSSHTSDERSVAEILLALANQEENRTRSVATPTAVQESTEIDNTTKTATTTEPVNDGERSPELMESSSSMINTSATTSKATIKKRPKSLDKAALEAGKNNREDQHHPGTSGSAKSTIYVNPNTPPCQAETAPCALDVLIAGMKSARRSVRADTGNNTKSNKRKRNTPPAPVTNKRVKTTISNNRKKSDLPMCDEGDYIMDTSDIVSDTDSGDEAW